jgi:hypothetical protein
MLEYQIVGESAFSVETYFGLGFIVVNEELDYEQTQFYRFMVSCILCLLVLVRILEQKMW